MPKAVRFDEYGGVDVLKVIAAPGPACEPDPGAGRSVPGEVGRHQAPGESSGAEHRHVQLTA